MVRVHHPKPGKQGNPSRGLRGAKASKQRNKHRVVVEDVDKNSQSVLYFQTDPPAGYTFIPAGNPELTAALKEFAKKANHKIYAVTTTPHAARHELSREVHRIGFHFPTEVVARVCAYYGIRLTSGGKLVEEKDDDKLFMKLYQKGQLVLDEKVRDQVTINTEAKQIIKDLFPNIPDNDLFQIIKTAFQLGDGKVGTADEIPLVRRAQLSVVAHIRHTYTEYDRLLREVPYSEARHQVEPLTLQKLIEWRGDNEDKQAVEDTLREVVVISDEEDSDQEIEDGQILDKDNVRVQLVSDFARQEQAGGVRARSPIEVHSSDEAPRGFRYVPQVVRRIPLQEQSNIAAARQQSRYAVWDKYRFEYRSALDAQPTRVVERVLLKGTSTPTATTAYSTRQPIYVEEAENQMRPPLRTVRQPSPPTYIRGADGRLYEKVVMPTVSHVHPAERMDYSPQQAMNPQSLRSQAMSPRTYAAAPHRRTTSFEENDGTIVASIEGSQRLPMSPAGRRNPFGESQQPYYRHSGGYHAQIDRAEPNPSTSSTEYFLKRRRVDASPPSPFLQNSLHYAASSDQRDNRQHPSSSQHLSTSFQKGTVDVIDLTDEGSHYRSRPQVYHEPLSTDRLQSSQGNGARMLYPVDREALVSKGPAVMNRLDTARGLYVQDNQSVENTPRSARYEDDVPRVRMIREPLHNPFNRTSLDDAGSVRVASNSASNGAVRYVSSDARDWAEMNGNHNQHSQRGFIQPREYISSSDPSYSLGPGHEHHPVHLVSSQNQYAAPQSQPGTRYRDDGPLRTAYVRN